MICCGKPLSSSTCSLKDCAVSSPCFLSALVVMNTRPFVSVVEEQNANYVSSEYCYRIHELE